MDPQEYKDALRELYCVNESNVQYFDSRDQSANDDCLDETGLLEKVQKLHLVKHGPEKEPADQGQNGPFVLITAEGDHIYGENRPLQISKNVLHECVEAKVFPPQMPTVYLKTGHHFSHRLLYDEEIDEPVAIYVMLRVPRLNRLIALTLHINLRTYTTIALLTSVVPLALSALRTRCTRQLSLLTQQPLHILNFVLEHRMRELEVDLEPLWKKVDILDLRTGIEPQWKAVPRHKKVKVNEDFGALLRELHDVGRELALLLRMSVFVEGLGGEFRRLIDRIERLREDVGVVGAGTRAARVEWEDQVAYDEDIVRMTRKKFEASIERVQAQINVTYSLIAQNSSEQNIRIARLTAKDGQTMKTITVLTLTFLPSTMLASLWDAGIFTLPQDKSWRVYVGATCSLTILVFALWFLYGWLVKIDNPTRAVEVEETDSKTV